MSRKIETESAKSVRWASSRDTHRAITDHLKLLQSCFY